MPQSNNSPTVEDALAYLNKGSLGRAESACRKILRRDPSSLRAWFVMALVHQDRKETAQAIEAFQQVITLDPNLAEAHYNLGTLLHSQKRVDEAAACHRRAIQLQPTSADAHNNLGTCLFDGGDLAGAMSCFQQAVQLDGNHPAAWLNFSNVIVKGAMQNDWENSEAICQRAVKLNPDCGQAYYNLGIVLERAFQGESAIEAFRRAVELNPTNEMWRVYLDSRQGADDSTKIPTEYVAVLFDAYADRFDHHLLGRLEYQVPKEMFAEVIACCGPEPLDILDLGCGTGLCGELFKPRSRTLVGVDLAPRMIEVTRGKNVYTELHVGEMDALMAGLTTQFDVVLAADVFVYVGDLHDTFANIHRVLRPGGLLAFSVEKYDGEGFVLGTSRRFSFSLPYLRGLMTTCQFHEERLAKRTLRKEGGEAVEGYIIVLRK